LSTKSVLLEILFRRISIRSYVMKKQAKNVWNIIWNLPVAKAKMMKIFMLIVVVWMKN